MDIPLNERLAALPSDNTGAESPPEFPREELERIFADLAMRRPPTTSLHRAWTLGELSVQVALAYGTRTVRGWFANENERVRAEAESNLRIALKIFHRLGYLRGALMKAGQAVSALPNVAPAQIADMLDNLHFNAPPMHYALIREVIENELGAPPESLFAEFDRTAFAAASIGQVHRAKLKTGEPVVVKIQYPGIARTIDADMRALGALMLPIRLLDGGEEVGRKFRQIHDTLNQEADYEREAQSLRLARTIFAGCDDFMVPQVYERFSGARVLTMGYIPGPHIHGFLAANPSQKLRDEFGAKLCFAWHHMLGKRINYADPHPGNYIFMSDGRLGLIDFGCVYPLSNADFQALRTAYHIGKESGGIEEARQMMIDVGAPPAVVADDTYVWMVRESCRWIANPFIETQPMDYGNPEHVRQRFLWQAEAARHKCIVKGEPQWLYYHRSELGLFGLLYRLRARVDMNALPVPNWWHN